MAKKTTLAPIPVFPDIVIALRYMGDNPPRFHWMLFVQNQNSLCGTKFHAIQDASGWSYESLSYSLHTSVPFGTLNDFDALLRRIPINERTQVTCRVWLREALRRLHNAGYIQCNVDAMEMEMLEYGTKAAKAISEGTFEVATLFTAENSK
ncbi:hypothetical protein CPB85DRAFT_1375405 [Mucidula mucida]|nr:hypothetical protein CPB85DRAFT_1375405 [Mucidula mucida]